MRHDWRITVEIDHNLVSGPGLRDFPVLLVVRDERLRNAQPAIGFFTHDSEERLAHEIIRLDADGSLAAWVRVPYLASDRDTRIEIRPTGDGAGSAEPDSNVWKDGFSLVVHDALRPRDSTGRARNISTETTPDGRRWLRVPDPANPDLDAALTLEAWVYCPSPRAEATAGIVSKWHIPAAFGKFDAYDAGRTDDMDTTGFFGAVFDGRYIYFSPQHDTADRHGKVLRYDTHGPFRDPGSWSAYDASRTDGMTTKGYYGAVFDGRYVYFVPRRESACYHSRVLRYDTRRDFHDPRSWRAHDPGWGRSSQSAAFDGRYIYFCPGQTVRPRQPRESAPTDGSPPVTGMPSDEVAVASGLIGRYDTQRDFDDPAAWTSHDAANTCGLDTRDFDGAVFDGRYVHFAPLSYGAVLRYDTAREFHDRAAWEAFDAKALGMKRCVGAVFDGRYVYHVPYDDNPVCVRCDTRGAFTDRRSWAAFPLAKVRGIPMTGFDGAFFDGRFVYFIPFCSGSRFHGILLRYDTLRPFEDEASWDWCDGGNVSGLRTVGFNGGATDGRFLYFAPWRDETGFPERIVGHGRVLRYDTTGDRASFSLRWCDLGHNGGLCAALPGPRFLVNTDRGTVSVAANRPPPPGRHHIAGVYDGRTIRLYLDGEPVNVREASGRIMRNDADVAVGCISEGAGILEGTISEVRISLRARSDDWIRTAYRNLARPEAFCRVADERTRRP